MGGTGVVGVAIGERLEGEGGVGGVGGGMVVVLVATLTVGVVRVSVPASVSVRLYVAADEPLALGRVRWVDSLVPLA